MNAPDALTVLRELATHRASTRLMTSDDARAILDHITALTAERDAAVAEVAQAQRNSEFAIQVAYDSGFQAGASHRGPKRRAAFKAAARTHKETTDGQ